MLPSVTEWLQSLKTKAQAVKLDHLDLLINGSAIEYPVFESLAKLTPAAPYVRLFDDTPEHELAEQGPVLVRLDWRSAEQVDWLAALLQEVHHAFRVLALLSRWDFDDLSEHLRRTTQATWNKGANTGVLRYYDTRLFRTFCEQLDSPQRRHFHAPVIQWHWIDHDRKQCEISGWNRRCDDLHKRSSGMHLTDAQVMHLQARSAAVQWLATHYAPLQQYGLDSRETLLRARVEVYLDLARQGRGKEHHAESVAEHLAKYLISPSAEHKGVS